MNPMKTTKRKSTERTISDIHAYHKQAMDLIEQRFKNKKDHPNYIELKRLLTEQIADELDTLYYSN